VTSVGAPAGPHPARADLVVRLRQLEGQLQEVQARLLTMGGEALPGMYLVVEAAGRSALLPASRVREVVRIVALTPLVGAAPHVCGTFVCRGAPVVVVDLGRALGAAREPELDAQIVILAGAPAVGLLVERVPRLVEDPRLFGGDVAEATPDGWRGSRLVAGLCVDGGVVLPVLDPTPLLAEALGPAA
jgi:purine-binding chemotaxis protein CheW